MARNALGSLRAVKVVWRRSFEDGRPYEREFHGIRKFEPISRKHEGLVDIYHVGRNDDDGYFYYVMELADDTGARLDTINEYRPLTLREELRARGRMPVSRALEVGAKLASALDHLHRAGLVHRDVKPSNIIFVGGAPKLADIGLVTEAADAGGVTYLGTKGYIPPEGPGTSAGDVYSLGKVLYEASVGLEVTHFPELPTAIAASSRDDPFFKLNQIVLKACETNPANRFASAAALRDALRELLNKLETPKQASP
jgi:serine/threonine protein kinase